jgi:hypothetical protein
MSHRTQLTQNETPDLVNVKPIEPILVYGDSYIGELLACSRTEVDGVYNTLARQELRRNNVADSMKPAGWHEDGFPDVLDYHYRCGPGCADGCGSSDRGRGRGYGI